ncbi:ATP-binding protein [Piscinibacter sp. HJYY11]|uniref:ATP-binding protein n=1 Tax=Piscinibacter sp. HJYY11 TaxID=2801333 RepID=UPI001920227F|nr:ATP-binding protein [Piscinibacter sp. HJYY11]MBL0727272.1 response regulator [Piscinibacter sp. HJYY11]
MTIRSRLVILIIALLLPLLAAMLAGVRFLYEGQRQALERGVHEAVRALTLVVERDIAQTETLLKVLATTPSLQEGDLRSFHEHAKEFAAGWDTVIVFSDLDGQQLLNTRQPFGAPLPRTNPDLLRLRQAVGPDATITSDLYFAPIGKRWSFAVQVPVKENGKVVGYLAMGGFADRLQQVFERQALPQTWLGTLVDRNFRVVARSRQAQQWVGTVSLPEHVRGLSARPSGQFKVKTLEGTPVIAIFHRSPQLGWTFIVGVPQEEIEREARNATVVLAVLSLILLGLGVLATVWVARSIVRPVTRLVALAESVGTDEVAFDRQPSGLREVDQIAEALARANNKIASARVDLQQEVQKARSEAAAAHANALQAQKLEALGRLTGGVAHDFNNLLMVVSSNAHVLARRLPEAWRESPQLQAIDRSVKTGTRLTRQLLAFARRQPLRLEVIALEDRLNAMASLVRTAIRSGVELTCTVAPGTWPVEVDVGEFELAILNLAVNANDAMPKGGKLTIRASNHVGAEDERFVVVEVSDTGLGIPADILDKVMEPFFTTKPPGQGTGLGLSQVYGFCQQAGGKLEIESKVGAGTTVRMMLKPTTESAVADAPVPASLQPLGCKVLLVEDNEELRKSTRELLIALGCEVELAPSADSARDRLTAKTDIELVLSDIRMPGQLNGLGLASWLRAHRPDLPFLLMTGYADELRTGQVDGHVVLSKPVEPETLAVAMRAALLVGRSQPRP